MNTHGGETHIQPVIVMSHEHNNDIKYTYEIEWRRVWINVVYREPASDAVECLDECLDEERNTYCTKCLPTDIIHILLATPLPKAINASQDAKISNFLLFAELRIQL